MSFIQKSNQVLFFIGGLFVIGFFTVEVFNRLFPTDYGMAQVRVVTADDAAATQQQPSYSTAYLGQIKDVYVFEQTVDMLISEASSQVRSERLIIGNGLSISSNTVNLLFVRQNGEKHQLFDIPTMISQIATARFEQETSPVSKNVYAVVRADSNQDQILNYIDRQEILVSEYDGSQLRSIMKDTAGFRIIGNNKVLIQSGTAAKPVWFLYDISTSQLTPLDSTFR
ncbi:hypothetical protein [Rheinheimera sp. MM224]|uniref:hypothetical protein n=1 Tax=Rheinheimera sp. MM224 TaxID=3019969 RepID=UPI0021F91777|nr:hypothetical protein [Rheinheimera sp. MM224]CAI3801370.1 hypothetical protein JAMGFMIE_02822 [Rheinheimera sp. MM224]